MIQIFKMALKDLKILMRDKAGAFFIIVFPILMGLFFGLMMSGFGGSSDSGKLKIAVVDQDQSEMSQKFVAALLANENLDVQSMGASPTRASDADDSANESESPLSQEELLKQAQESVRLGNRVGVVVVPEGFGKTAGIFWEEPPKLMLGMDPSRAAEGGMMQGYIMEAIGQLVGERFNNPAQFKPFILDARKQVEDDKSMNMVNRQLLLGFFGSLDSMFESMDKIQNDADEDTQQALESNTQMQFADIQPFDISRKFDPNSQRGQLQKLKSQWDISFPQAMLWGVLGCVAGFAISIAREDTLGTMVRLKAAPITRFQILAGKALACFITVLLVIGMLTFLGVMLGLKPHSYALLVLAALCTAFCFVGIMMTMSVLGRTEQSVSGSGWAINMVMAMLGGCMIPVMFMPEIIQKFSVLSPIMWAIRSIEGAIWREFTVTEMLLPCGILIAVGIVGLAIGTTILKRRV